MAKQPESYVVQSMMKMLNLKFPGFYFKVHGGPFQKAGLPDILGVHQGRFIGVEVKVPGKEHTLTEIQKLAIKRIKLAGGIAFMSTNNQYTEETLRRELNESTSTGTPRDIKRPRKHNATHDSKP